MEPERSLPSLQVPTTCPYGMIYGKNYVLRELQNAKFTYVLTYLLCYLPTYILHGAEYLGSKLVFS
jgi:hypothetical protein